MANGNTVISSELEDGNACYDSYIWDDPSKPLLSPGKGNQAGFMFSSHPTLWHSDWPSSKTTTLLYLPILANLETTLSFYSWLFQSGLTLSTVLSTISSTIFIPLCKLSALILQTVTYIYSLLLYFRLCVFLRVAALLSVIEAVIYFRVLLSCLVDSS